MTQIAPPGWGQDALTDYLSSYRSNQFATFANKGQSMTDLIQIDGLFHRFLVGAINPRPFYPMTFMLRAHSAYRAGVGAVMAGQLYESQALLRLCLEHAAYGFYIGADKDRMERWLRRGDSDEHSDIDLLVRMMPGRSLFDIGGLLMDLRDLFGTPVHVVAECGLRPRMRKRVLHEAILI